jgi:hypothetical protein
LISTLAFGNRLSKVLSDKYREVLSVKERIFQFEEFARYWIYIRYILPTSTWSKRGNGINMVQGDEKSILQNIWRWANCLINR